MEQIMYPGLLLLSIAIIAVLIIYVKKVQDKEIKYGNCPRCTDGSLVSVGMGSNGNFGYYCRRCTHMLWQDYCKKYVQKRKEGTLIS